LQGRILNCMMRLIKKYADQIGISGSVLCLIHCLALPFLGILSIGASSGSHGHTHFFVGDDIIFALVAIVAAYFAAKNTEQTALKVIFLTLSITFGFSLIVSELYHTLEGIIYLSHFCAMGLIVVHIYHYIQTRKRLRCQLS